MSDSLHPLERLLHDCEEALQSRDVERASRALSAALAWCGSASGPDAAPGGESLERLRLLSARCEGMTIELRNDVLVQLRELSSSRRASAVYAAR